MTDQEYRRLYYRVNRERQREYARTYYAANREKLMEQNRQYRLTHADTINARIARNYEWNRADPAIRQAAAVFRAWRRQKGLTQKQVSAMIWLSMAAISKAETARIKMQEKMMEVLRREGLDRIAG